MPLTRLTDLVNASLQKLSDNCKQKPNFFRTVLNFGWYAITVSYP